MHVASKVCVRERVMRMHRDARERDGGENARAARERERGRERERVNERLRDRRAVRISRLRRRRTPVKGSCGARYDFEGSFFRVRLYCPDKKVRGYRVSRRDARP